AVVKVTLYAFWAMGQKDGQVRFLRMTDFLNDTEFVKGLGPTTASATEALTDGVERAVPRGTLLHVNIESADGVMDLYFFNTENGRAAFEGITKGEWRPNPDEDEPITLLVERPNIFILYEQNIGPLTPIVADELRDAEQSYPVRWIEEAIETAVANNVRKWRYISAILERWRQEGKKDESYGRDSRRSLSQQVPDE